MTSNGKQPGRMRPLAVPRINNEIAIPEFAPSNLIRIFLELSKKEVKEKLMSSFLVTCYCNYFVLVENDDLNSHQLSYFSFLIISSFAFAFAIASFFFSEFL